MCLFILVYLLFLERFICIFYFLNIIAGLSFNVLERAGIPSMDAEPDCPPTSSVCPDKSLFKYGYSSVWKGNFTDCTWDIGECISPLKGKNCLVYSCSQNEIKCPPDYVERCPGWTEYQCANYPQTRIGYY